MNTGTGFLVVFKDSKVRIAPTTETFARSGCSTLRCQNCPGRRCDIRSATPLEQILDKEGMWALQEFLTSPDTETPPSVRQRALGIALEAGGVPALHGDEEVAVLEFLTSDYLESSAFIRSMALETLRLAAETARRQNAFC